MAGNEIISNHSDSQMVPDRLCVKDSADEPHFDTLTREVYCLLGMPIDVVEMPAVLDRIEVAASSAAPYVICTPNLNFLAKCQQNPIFRESLLLGDLCPADGVAIVWIARITGIPIKERVAGSDIFEALKTKFSPTKPLKVFLFGGDVGVAAKASNALNMERGGLRCVGAIYPGFGTVEEMSGCNFIEAINSSHADFLLASLSAEKGQLWLVRNHHHLTIPIRVHLGAVMNFQAGTVRRAPLIIRRWGLEWMWRIKEEPQLWTRYWKDGRSLLGLLITCVLPLAIWTQLQRLRYDRQEENLLVRQVEGPESVIVILDGMATASHVEKAIPLFREAITTNKHVVINFAATRAIDARFLGLLIMLRKSLREHGTTLRCMGISSRLQRMFRLNRAGFLLVPDQ